MTVHVPGWVFFWGGIGLLVPVAFVVKEQPMWLRLCFVFGLSLVLVGTIIDANNSKRKEG